MDTSGCMNDTSSSANVEQGLAALCPSRRKRRNSKDENNCEINSKSRSNTNTNGNISEKNSDIESLDNNNKTTTTTTTTTPTPTPPPPTTTTLSQVQQQLEQEQTRQRRRREKELRRRDKKCRSLYFATLYGSDNSRCDNYSWNSYNQQLVETGGDMSIINNSKQQESMHQTTHRYSNYFRFIDDQNYISSGEAAYTGSKKNVNHPKLGGLATFLASQSPRILPNNTLIADLSQCHSNLIHKLPEIGLESFSKRLLIGLKQCCQPKQQNATQAHRLIESTGHNDINDVDNHTNIHRLNDPDSRTFRTRRRSFNLDLEHQQSQDLYYSTTKAAAPIDNVNHHIHNKPAYQPLRLDLMLPKSTSSLPASLIKELDAMDLLEDNRNLLLKTNNAPPKDCSRIIDNNHETAKDKSDDMMISKCRTTSSKNTNNTSRRRALKFEMPEALLGARVRLKSEDYDKALCVLTNDIRYQLHLLLYSRVQSLWLLLSTILCIFIPFVFLTPELTILAISAGFWFVLQFMGAAATFAFRKRLNLYLERAVAQANSYFMDHNLMLGVINFGGIFAKSKLMVPLVYFDTSPCRIQIESVLSDCGGLRPMPIELMVQKTPKTHEVNDDNNNNDKKQEQHRRQQISTISKSHFSSLIINDEHRQLGLAGQPRSDVSETGSQLEQRAIALARSQLAKKIVLKYSQRWISQYDRRKLVFSCEEDDQIEPRHLSTGKCICQFFEAQYLERKSKRQIQGTNNNNNNNNKVQARTEKLLANGNRGTETIQVEGSQQNAKIIGNEQKFNGVIVQSSNINKSHDLFASNGADQSMLITKKSSAKLTQANNNNVPTTTDLNTAANQHHQLPSIRDSYLPPIDVVSNHVGSNHLDDRPSKNPTEEVQSTPLPPNGFTAIPVTTTTTKTAAELEHHQKNQQEANGNHDLQNHGYEKPNVLSAYHHHQHQPIQYQYQLDKQQQQQQEHQLAAAVNFNGDLAIKQMGFSMFALMSQS